MDPLLPNHTLYNIFQIIMVTYCFNIDFILIDLIHFVSVSFISFWFDFDLFHFISVDFALFRFGYISFCILQVPIWEGYTAEAKERFKDNLHRYYFLIPNTMN